MAKNIIVSINVADGSVYTNAKSLGINGDNLGAPGLTILGYIQLIQEMKVLMIQKNFQIYINDIVTEL